MSRVDIVSLARSLNAIADEKVTNMMLSVLQQDPCYSEDAFVQEERGVRFDLRDMSSNQVHILSEIAKHVSPSDGGKK